MLTELLQWLTRLVERDIVYKLRTYKFSIPDDTVGNGLAVVVPRNSEGLFTI